MVKRTLAVYECAICGKEGERYMVTYPDGQMTLDRCTRHAKALASLRNEAGSWEPLKAASKSAFKVSSVEEIRKQI